MIEIFTRTWVLEIQEGVPPASTNCWSLRQHGRCLYGQRKIWLRAVSGFKRFAIPPLLYLIVTVIPAWMILIILSRWKSPTMRLLHFATNFHGSQVHRKHPEACQPQGTACATACGAPGACATTNACQGQACPSPYLSVEPKAGQGGARASCMSFVKLADVNNCPKESEFVVQLLQHPTFFVLLSC